MLHLKEKLQVHRSEPARGYTIPMQPVCVVHLLPCIVVEGVEAEILVDKRFRR